MMIWCRLLTVPVVDTAREGLSTVRLPQCDNFWLAVARTWMKASEPQTHVTRRQDPCLPEDFKLRLLRAVELLGCMLEAFPLMHHVEATA